MTGGSQQPWDSTLGAVDAFLRQLLQLPALEALAATTAGTTADAAASSGAPPPAVAALRLDRAALRAAGLSDHAVNGLYRALLGHAEAYGRVVDGEVAQLRRVLLQHGGGRALAALELLAGPMEEVGGWVGAMIRKRALRVCP